MELNIEISYNQISSESDLLQWRGRKRFCIGWDRIEAFHNYVTEVEKDMHSLFSVRYERRYSCLKTTNRNLDVNWD